MNLSRVMGARRTREFIHIRLPATLSPLFTGLKIGATYAVTGAVIGEWTASSQQGLGTYLLSANASLQHPTRLRRDHPAHRDRVISFLLVMAVETVATPWRNRSTAPRLSLRRGPRPLAGLAPGGATEPRAPVDLA